MNERILELFEKAANKDFPTCVSSIHPNQLERFAELIVRECAEVIAPMGDWCGGHGEPSMPSTMECAKKLKEHFGVE